MWKYLLNNRTARESKVQSPKSKVQSQEKKDSFFDFDDIGHWTLDIGHFSSGYTLLEVLVATMVISLAMAGLMSIFLLAAHQGGMTVNKGGAAFYQTRILEELKHYIVEDPAGYSPLTDIQHSCTAGSAFSLGNPHYILEGVSLAVAGGVTHEAIRPDGTEMLPSTDDLVSKYNATVSYTVEDQDAGGNGRVSKKITVDIDYEVPSL